MEGSTDLPRARETGGQDASPENLREQAHGNEKFSGQKKRSKRQLSPSGGTSERIQDSGIQTPLARYQEAEKTLINTSGQTCISIKKAKISTTVTKPLNSRAKTDGLKKIAVMLTPNCGKSSPNTTAVKADKSDSRPNNSKVVMAGRSDKTAPPNATAVTANKSDSRPNNSKVVMAGRSDKTAPPNVTAVTASKSDSRPSNSEVVMAGRCDKTPPNSNAATASSRVPWSKEGEGVMAARSDKTSQPNSNAVTTSNSDSRPKDSEVAVAARADYSLPILNAVTANVSEARRRGGRTVLGTRPPKTLEEIASALKSHSGASSTSSSGTATATATAKVSSDRRPEAVDFSATNFASRPPREWSNNMGHADRCWIGQTVFTAKGRLVSRLQNWWHPPAPPGPELLTVPDADDFFLRRLFLWMPKRMWSIAFRCPRCKNINNGKGLTSKGLYTRVRLVLDLKDYYYLASEYLECNNSDCRGTFIAWDHRLLDQLSYEVRVLFPAVLTYKYACDVALLSLLRSRSLGNSCTSIQKKINELHCEEWMRKTIAYLSSCKRHKEEKGSKAADYRGQIPRKPVPSAKWFLACYIRDVYTRIDLLKASATSVFGTVLKIDSTKKMTRKLQGKEAGSAKWMTNVGNERGEILVSVLTASESTLSLQPMADGLVQRFEKANQPPPLLLYSDRDCCSSQASTSGSSKLKALFAGWPGLIVRLDIYHYMRRLASGCQSESHPLYGVFMDCLAQCIFEWDKDDLARLHEAKRGEMRMSGVADPSEVAVKKATTKKEMVRHCRRRTRGPESTYRLIEALLDEFSQATDSLGVPLFRDEMLMVIWPEQQRHLTCIHDPPTVQLYTKTGSVTKGGVELPVFRCARGSSSLECFHLHQASFIAGTAANPVTYQACLLEGVTRWNSMRATAAVDDREGESVPLLSFDVSLKHSINSLSKFVRGEELLPNFVMPGAYTGERFGVDYLGPQADLMPLEKLEAEIDEAVEEYGYEPEVDLSENPEDITLAVPADLPSEVTDIDSRDDDEEADEHQSTATDSAGLSGWDKVNKLAETLLYVKPCVTDSQVVEIKRLYLSLEEYDRKPLTFSPRMKKATGRFKQTKGNRSGHIGVEAMARCFVTAGQPVSPPSRSRVVEAICIRLCDESADQRSQGPGKPYLSKWKVVLQKYNQIRRAVYNSPLHDEISLQLFAINESTLADWFKNKVRIDEIKLLMQGLAGVPKPPLTSEEQLPPAQELPKRAPRPEYATSAIGKETDKASVATTRTFADPGEGLSRTTAYRRRRAMLDAENKAAQGGPVKKRMEYTCQKCHQPQNVKTGHSQFYGQVYCPFEAGQLPKDEWLAKKREERAEKKKQDSATQSKPS